METDTMEQEIDLTKYLNVLKRWLSVIVLGTFVAGGLALVVSLLMPPVYEAEANVASVKSFSQISLSPEYRTLSEAQLTQGLDIAARQKALIAIARGGEIASAVIAKSGDGLTAEERQISNLLRTVTVSADGDLIRIKAQNRDPQKAVEIANTWAQAYTDRVNQLYTENPTTVDKVQGQTDAAWQSYQTAQAALDQFVGQNRIDALSAEIASKQNAITDLYAAQRSLERLSQDAQSLRELIVKDSALTSNDTGSRLALLLIRANAATLSYSAPSTSAEPSLSSSQRWAAQPSPVQQPIQIQQSSQQPFQVQLSSSALGDVSQASIRAQLEPVIASLEARKKLVDAQLADPSLQLQILSLQKEKEQQTAKEQELTTARDLAWSTYKTLASKMQEVQLTQRSSGTIVRLAGSATVPDQPVAPKKMVNTLLAAVVGLMLSIGIVFGIESFDPSIRSTQELARDLDVPIFEVRPGAIPPANSGINSASFGASPLPPVCYQIWANLFLGTQPCGKTLLVANLGREQDSGPVVANLGLIAAQAGRSVILVDSNVLCPSLNQIFGIPNTRGWGNLLGEEHPDIGSYLQATSVKDLMVLTSGTSSFRSGEAIVSPRLASAMSALREKADLVLFTSASPSSAADALLMARQVEGVLLLVAERVTPRDMVVQFREQLQNIGATVLGVIMFQAQDGALVRLRHIINSTRLQPTANEIVSLLPPGAPGEA